MNSSDRRKIAVIGAGFSGLAAALRINDVSQEQNLPYEVTLFDSSDGCGGLVGTDRTDGFLVETGADAFITSKPGGIELCRRLGLEQELIGNDPTHSGLYVVRGGRPVRVPEGFNMMAPSQFGPVMKSPLFSWRGKLRMALERWVPRRNETTDESLASFVTRRVGNEAFERLVQPLVGGIYTSDPHRLSMQATMSRFIDMERDSGSLARAMRNQRREHQAEATGTVGVRYGLFATLRYGMGQFLDRLEEEVARFTIVRYGTPVLTVHGSGTDQPGWQLGLEGGDRESFDAVVVGTSAPIAARLLAESQPQLAGRINAIEHASSALIITAHRLSDFDHPLDAFGLIVPSVEERQILAVSMTSRKYPDRAPTGHVLLRTFVGGALQSELLQRSDEELVEITRKELSDLLGLHSKPLWTRVVRYPDAMPQYHVGHLDRVEEIRRIETGCRGLAIAGNALEGVGIPDVIQSGNRAAGKILGEFTAGGSV